MTKKDQQDFEEADKCHICNKKYSEKDILVRDHCHKTGKYKGSAHQDCNMNFKQADKIPVIFHHLRGCNSHFIMQEIGQIAKKHLVFLDSFQFMSSSLEKLVSNLPDKAFKYISEPFKNEQFKLMKQNRVYPYDYMSSFDKFNEKQLPKKDFYSVLNNEHISDKDYTHAKNIWKTFNLKSTGEYHDLYLKSDILLLCDVFENFRKTCLQYYKLEASHYFTSPGSSWDALLKMNVVKLEIIVHIDMFQFI